MTVRCTPTRVLGPTALSTWLAACCGVSGTCVCAGEAAACADRAGRVSFVTLFLLLCHSHTWRPSRITSVSPSVTGMASRR